MLKTSESTWNELNVKWSRRELDPIFKARYLSRTLSRGRLISTARARPTCSTWPNQGIETSLTWSTAPPVCHPNAQANVLVDQIWAAPWLIASDSTWSLWIQHQAEAPQEKDRLLGNRKHGTSSPAKNRHSQNVTCHKFQENSNRISQKAQGFGLQSSSLCKSALRRQRIPRKSTSLLPPVYIRSIGVRWWVPRQKYLMRKNRWKMTHVDGFCRHVQLDLIQLIQARLPSMPPHAFSGRTWAGKLLKLLLNTSMPSAISTQFPVPDGKYVDHGRDRKTKLSESTTTATALGIGSGCHKSLDAGMNRKLKHSNHLMCI